LSPSIHLLNKKELTMKKLFQAMLLTSILIPTFSCKKNAEKIIKIEVVECKTNMPVTDASIEFYKLGDFGLSCICWRPKLFLRIQTDANAIFSVAESDFNSTNIGIIISKQTYFWTGLTSHIQTKNQFDAIGQVTLRLIKTNSYPVGSRLSIFLRGLNRNNPSDKPW